MKRQQVAVDLGGWTVAVQSPDPELLDALTARYRGFLTAASACFTVRHDPSAAAFVVDGMRCFSRLEPAHRRAWIAGAASVERVDGVLRTALAELIDGALLMHGALLAENDAGWLCCGGSGSGKSTLARLLPAQALCDEQVLLVRGPTGFELRSLPFWTARPGRVALAGVHLLEHAADHRRTRLPAVTALRSMAQHVRWPDDPARAQDALTILTELVSSYPVWRLGFALRPDVWELIRAGAAA